MLFIDTHTHLFLPQFDNDRDTVINSAIKQGVKKLFLPNIDSSTIIPMLNIAKAFSENCFPMIGLHPSSVKDNFEKELQIVEKWLKKEKYYAIGETGIDLYRDKTFKQQQIIAFKKQLHLAKKYNLPIVIHSRESYNEIFQILDRMDGTKACPVRKNDRIGGIFHCFSGTYQQAQKAISLGFKLGIGGIVTFKNAGLDKVVEKIDLRHIVLETDSPYLAPVPNRGKRNESAYIIYIANKIAELHKISVQKVAEITSKNALEVFGI